MSTARPTNESANEALGQASDDGHSITSNATTSSLALVPYNPNPFPLLCLSLQIHDPNLRKLLLPTAGVTPSVDVPSCIVPTILSFCDAVTLSRASCTCRDWRTLAACNKIWENLCRKKFGVSADCINPKPDPTKLLYVLTHRSLKEACRSDINPFTGRARQSGLRGALGQRIPIAAML